jgi:hypothetical protein
MRRPVEAILPGRVVGREGRRVSENLSAAGREALKLSGWFLLGAALTASFQLLFVSRYKGDWSVLLHVGSLKPHRAFIENELGPVKCLDDLGHDGQVNYLIARDPFNLRHTNTVMGPWDNPPYRFRRILYPLLAGGFGLFGPRAAVYGLALWLVIGAGLIAAASASLSASWELPGSVLLLALLNPGTYLSAQVLTNDVLATGLALSGLALWVRGREFAAVLLLAAAVLTRETSILVSLSLALTVARQRGIRAALALALAAALPCVCWSLWVKWTIPGTDGFENLGPPFVGLFRSIFLWKDPTAVVFGMLAIALIMGSLWIALAVDNLFVRVSCLAWVCLAAVMSVEVWDHPGNVLRALSPLWCFAVLGYGMMKKSAASEGEGPPANLPETANSC